MELLTGSADGTVPALLRGRASLTPDANFLGWGDRWWSYADTLARCEQVAGFLRDVAAAGPSHRVASYLSNCPEALWTWFGTQLAGSVYVPLNRSHRGPLLGDLLVRSRAEVLVTSSDALADLPPLSMTSVRHLLVIDGNPEELAGLAVIPFERVWEAARWEGVDPSPNGVASVMYTSGSTGGRRRSSYPTTASLGAPRSWPSRSDIRARTSGTPGYRSST